MRWECTERWKNYNKNPGHRPQGYIGNLICCKIYCQLYPQSFSLRHQVPGDAISVPLIVRFIKLSTQCGGQSTADALSDIRSWNLYAITRFNANRWTNNKVVLPKVNITSYNPAVSSLKGTPSRYTIIVKSRVCFYFTLAGLIYHIYVLCGSHFCR